jgi:hypothetical protein
MPLRLQLSLSALELINLISRLIKGATPAAFYRHYKHGGHPCWMILLIFLLAAIR